MNESLFTRRGHVYLGEVKNDASIDYNNKVGYICFHYKFASMDVSDTGQEISNIERGVITIHYHSWLTLPCMIRDINGREYYIQSVDEDEDTRRMRLETVFKRTE